MKEQRVQHNSIEVQQALEVTLTSNPRLLAIIDDVENTPEVRWDDLAQKMKRIRGYSNDNVGDFAELHVRDVLTRIDPVLTELPSIKETNTYVFKKTNYEAFIVQERENERAINITDYDALTVVDGLPVLWEVKSSLTYNKNVTGIKEMFRHRSINKKFKPLQEYYDTDTFGYVLVTFPGVVGPDATHKENFLRNGGRHATLNAIAPDFHMKALQTKFKYRL